MALVFQLKFVGVHISFLIYLLKKYLHSYGLIKLSNQTNQKSSESQKSCLVDPGQVIQNLCLSSPGVPGTPPDFGRSVNLYLN